MPKYDIRNGTLVQRRNDAARLAAQQAPTLTKEDFRHLFNVMRRRKIKQLCSTFAGTRDYGLWNGLTKAEADYAFIRAFNNAHLNVGADSKSVATLAGKRHVKTYIEDLAARLEALS